ncbi:MAG: hypothetical protein AAF694_08565 [Bacteroidota bacterium]
MKPLTLIPMAMLISWNFLGAQKTPMLFPHLKAETLKKQEIVFPKDIRKEVNILVLVFEQRAQSLVDTWADIILTEYEPQGNISYHEVPMISGWWFPISWQIDNWMRGGIPEQYHSNTATFYGNRKPYFQALEMDNPKSCYVFVLDKMGFIRFRAEGVRTPEKELPFRKAIGALLGDFAPQ